MSKVGKAMRVANEFLLKNGFEEKEVKRKSRKRQLREETKEKLEQKPKTSQKQKGKAVFKK